MASRNVLKIPVETATSSKRPSSPKGDLLISVQNPAQSGKSTTTLTDLTLEATDGQTVFSSHLYSSRLAKLLTKETRLTVSQFESVLSHILLKRPLPVESEDDSDAADLNGIGLVAIPSRTRKDKSMILRFQRVVGDVKHYIAEINLPETPDVELNIVEWALAAVEQGSQADYENDRLRVRLQEAEKGSQAMKQQLDELRLVKEKDEKILLEKFVEVLNSKKARIRSLEQELGGGKFPWKEVDEDAIKEEDEQNARPARGGARGRGRGAKAGPSRSNKRKQAQTQADSEIIGSGQEDGAAEQQEELDDETDRESLQELPADEDVVMTPDSDDQPEIRHRTHASTTRDSSAVPDTLVGGGKQHTLRTKPQAGSEDMSTDDEL